MPCDDGGGLHDPDGRSPPRPHARQQDPHESVGPTQPEPFWCYSLEDGELMAEGEHLRFKFGSRSKATANRRQKSDEGWTHDGARYQQRRAKLNRNNMYRVFGRDRYVTQF